MASLLVALRCVALRSAALRSAKHHKPENVKSWYTNVCKSVCWLYFSPKQRMHNFSRQFFTAGVRTLNVKTCSISSQYNLPIQAHIWKYLKACKIYLLIGWKKLIRYKHAWMNKTGHKILAKNDKRIHLATQINVLKHTRIL